MTQVPPYQRPPASEFVWAAIADHLAARITAGEFPPGAMLPGERALVTEYDAALGTIRRAVRELTERGVVVVRAGKGTFVRARE